MPDSQEVKFQAAPKAGDKTERPWGSYTILSNGRGFQVKRLTVKAGQRLSLQWHRHRDEHWIVARGTAQVTVGDKQINLGRGQSMDVPRTVHHRIANLSSIDPLDIIEVQTGDYLGEDDIVRVEDDYGRAGGE